MSIKLIKLAERGWHHESLWMQYEHSLTISINKIQWYKHFNLRRWLGCLELNLTSYLHNQRMCFYKFGQLLWHGVNIYQNISWPLFVRQVILHHQHFHSSYWWKRSLKNPVNCQLLTSVKNRRIVFSLSWILVA